MGSVALQRRVYSILSRAYITNRLASRHCPLPFCDPGRTEATQAAIVAAFNSAAARIESLAKSLNQSLGDEVALG